MDSEALLRLECELRWARKEAGAVLRHGVKVHIGTHVEWSTQPLLRRGVLIPEGEAEMAGGQLSTAFATIRVPGGLWLSDLSWLEDEAAAAELEGTVLAVSGVQRGIVLDTDTGALVHWHWALTMDNPTAPEGDLWGPARQLDATVPHLHLEKAVPGALEAWERGTAAVVEQLKLGTALTPEMRELLED
jgi:hypothetical protein